MVNDCLHALGQLCPGRWHHLAIGRLDWSSRQTVERLAADLDALAHLGHADQVAVVAVADGSRRHGEIVLLVAAVRVGLADVQGNAGAAQDRTGAGECERVVGRQDTDALRPLAEDRVARQQLLVTVDVAGHGVDEG